MKTKKYNFEQNMMFVNTRTLDKIRTYGVKIFKVHWLLKTIQDFNIFVSDDIEDNVVYFYVNRLKCGEIVKIELNEILK